MFVVIIGDITLGSDQHRLQVHNLIDDLKQKYTDLIIVTSGCEKGIGRFVRERCVNNQRDVGFVEIAIYPWATMSSSRLAKVYLCKNASLLEIGEEFHIFAAGGPQHSYIRDLITRVQEAEHKPLLTIYEEERK